MSDGAQRAALIAFGLLNLGLGLLMAISPGTFFDQIGDYGVRNDHYIRDVSTFYLAGGLAQLLAAQRRSWRVPVCVLSAVWYGLHALNHLTDIDLAKSTARGVTATVLLALGALAFAAIARAASRERAGEESRPPAGLSPRPPDYPPGD